jgi:hypothetical protein
MSLAPGAVVVAPAGVGGTKEGAKREEASWRKERMKKQTWMCFFSSTINLLMWLASPAIKFPQD